MCSSMVDETCWWCHETGSPLFIQSKILRMHRIDAQAELSQLGASSKVNTSGSFLTHLHPIGYETADDWLDRNFTPLGRRLTLDLLL